MAQIHKKFTDDQVKDLIKRYILAKKDRKYIQEILNIKKSRFFELIKQYRIDPGKFSIQYDRKTKTRSIDSRIEKNIIKELKVENRNKIYRYPVSVQHYFPVLKKYPAA